MTDRLDSKPRARDVLRAWGKARGYLYRAAEFLELARSAALPAVRKRYLTIAEHYRTLAEVEKRLQNQISRMPDPT